MADITFTDRNYNDRQNLLTTYSVVVAILNAPNDITFVIVAPSAHLSANSQERWFWLIVVLPEVLIQHHFEATKGQGSDMPIVHACAGGCLVARWIKRWTTDPGVPGSSPTIAKN